MRCRAWWDAQGAKCTRAPLKPHSTLDRSPISARFIRISARSDATLRSLQLLKARRSARPSGASERSMPLNRAACEACGRHVFHAARSFDPQKVEIAESSRRRLLLSAAASGCQVFHARRCTREKAEEKQ